MDNEQLFQKYAKLLVWFANTYPQYIRARHDFRKDNIRFPIAKVTPDSYHEYLGKKDGLHQYKGYFYTANIIAQKLSFALNCLEVVSFLIKDFEDAQKALIHYLGFNNYNFPHIYHGSYTGNATTSSAIHDGAGSLTWSTIRGSNTAGDGSNYNGLTNVRLVRTMLDTVTYRNRRGTLRFDTSSITGGATVTAAQLKVYVYNSVTNANSTALVISAFTGTGSPVDGHYDAATYFNSLNTPTEFMDTRPTFAGLSTAAVNTWTLNANGRSNVATGASAETKYGFRTGRDVDDAAPTGLNEFFIDFDAGSNPAQLVVTYGSAYTATYNETITIVQTLSKASSKSLNETVTIVSALTKALTKSLTETIVISSTLTKATAKSLSETVTIVSNLTKALTRSFSESITIVSALTSALVTFWTKHTPASGGFTQKTPTTTVWTEEEPDDPTWTKT